MNLIFSLLNKKTMKVPNQSSMIKRTLSTRSLNPEQGITPQRIKLVTVKCNCDTHTDICVCDNGRVLHNTLGSL